MANLFFGRHLACMIMGEFFLSLALSAAEARKFTKRRV